MANQDFFAEIAMTQHPIGNNDKEIPPRETTNVSFKKSEKIVPYDKIKVAQDYTDEERYEQFQDGMDQLRKRYLPFMENHLPPTQTTQQKEFKQFDFRYAKEHEIFTQLKNQTDWEQITIPDYRGPEGKWKGYYRTTFSIERTLEHSHFILHFQCVDYKALVYINGNYVGGHEGFFAPFEFDITDYLQDENELIIEVQNDFTTKGDDGPVVDGDKIYAATGPGWDDAETGWHHCPPGAGVFGKVILEERPQFCIDDIFPRPDIDNNHVEMRVGVFNYEQFIPEDFDMEIKLCPKNFKSEQPDDVVEFHANMKVIGMGKNEYRYQVPMETFRLWTPDEPYLYGAICTIRKDGNIISQKWKQFGMRKFVSDETTEPKGKFFLNNKPIVLRGANEMGHLQQCVMNGDFDQLRDDILIGKLCNMNYYRLTQRAVQEEIYDYMDMLGMMNQSDLPLFSTLRRNQAVEAVRQSAEMEHLLRSHPSAVLMTFINEPVCIRRTEDPNSKYSKRYELKGHRHLYRDELEAFFVAARKMIYIENPDRVIKNVEGDYDPPTQDGMPDFHTYTMWYSHHPIPVGKLSRGYIPPVKQGWMIGCGEYGAEGLDPVELMQKRYPESWLAKNEKGEWYPINITRAQTNAMHGDWFEEKTTMEDWVEASQTHQALATSMMTDAFRRRADYIGHTAIHLLIDAWPAGWMKTLVDCERRPKKAYYSYMDSLKPYRVNLRCDRHYLYEQETVPVEAWLLNDTSEPQTGHIVASVRMDGNVYDSYELNASIDAAYAECVGKIMMEVPKTDKEALLQLDAVICDKDNNVLNAERLEFYVYPSVKTQHDNQKISVIGERAKNMAKAFGYENIEPAHDENTKALLLSELEGNEEKVETCLKNGGTAIVILPDIEQVQTTIGSLAIETKKGPKVYYTASREDLKKYHFHWTYNENLDYMDILARKYILGDEGEELLYTYAKSGANGEKAPKQHFPLVKKYQQGSGCLYIVSLVLDGKIGVNANLDKFLIDCIEGRV